MPRFTAADTQMMRIEGALFSLALLALAACGIAANTINDLKVAPSVFDAALVSNAVLINGTGINPTVPDPAAPVAGGCLVRFANIKGNDVNCSDASLYSNQQACLLNPYPGYANFLVAGCPTSNLIGSCFYGVQTTYYYQGYLIISPDTPVSVLSAGCVAAGGIWR